MLARFWFAYYWAFVDPAFPIRQGHDRTDLVFREELTHFRQAWQMGYGEDNPAEGFYIKNVMATSRYSKSYPAELEELYQTCLSKVMKSLHQPIRYAGTGEYNLFQKPTTLAELPHATPIPRTQPQDVCLFVPMELWQTFQERSQWIEALCVDEWCSFTQTVNQTNPMAQPSTVYNFLTVRPDKRRMVSWEHNQIDMLLMEGFKFHCPWTSKPIMVGVPYDLDPIVPIAIQPITELWNLMPSDPIFNAQTKKDRLPSHLSFERAKPVLVETYQQYWSSKTLKPILERDVHQRFGNLAMYNFPAQLVEHTQNFIYKVATRRHIAEF